MDSKITAERPGKRSIHVTTHRPPRFQVDTQSEELAAYLDEHGYVVVANAVPEEAVDGCLSLLWDFLEGIPSTGVRRDDIKTWDLDGDWLPSEQNGIISGFGFGQSPFMWKLRLMPRVKSAFESVWKTKDLIVSFDGGNVFRPWAYNSKWKTKGGWYHVDQNSHRPGRKGKVCVQGLITLLPANGETGGLTVIPGSHKHHTEMCERSEIAKNIGDFVPVDNDDSLLDNGAVLLCAEPGDLILWDSRTIHCNSPALGETAEVDKKDNSRLLRACGYVCMTPSSFATKEVLAQRKEGYIHNYSTSHWPQAFVVAGVGLPGTPENEYSKIPNAQRHLIEGGTEGPSRERCSIM